MTLCHVCHRWQAHAVCEDCISTFAQPHHRCHQCALRLPSFAQTLCDTCQSRPSVLARCIAAVDYDFPWSTCITRLKFGDDVGLAAILARLMRHTPWAESELEQADRVIPMPLAPDRLQERGYNQALELARHLEVRHLDTTSLQRLPSPVHQVGADRAQRWEQAHESFWLTPHATGQLSEQRIVLIDDVITTGATVHAAAVALQRAGAARVSALAFARTPQRQRNALG